MQNTYRSYSNDEIILDELEKMDNDKETKN